MVQWLKNIVIESSWKGIILCVGLKCILLLTGKVAIYFIKIDVFFLTINLCWHLQLLLHTTFLQKKEER